MTYRFCGEFAPTRSCKRSLVLNSVDLMLVQLRAPEDSCDTNAATPESFPDSAQDNRGVARK
jgi:hypothetical protein